MKKISKITLENFRVFSGKNEIDFNNSDKSRRILFVYMERMDLEKHHYLMVSNGFLQVKFTY